MDVLGSADVNPAGRLRNNKDVGIATELAGNDNLLDISAGQVLGRRVDIRRLDAIFGSEALAALLDR